MPGTYYCDALSCRVSSKDYVECVGKCGRKMHPICGGYIRPAFTPDHLEYFKFICEKCETFFANSIVQYLEIKDMLHKHLETVGKIVKQVETLQGKVDNNEQFIGDIDNALHMNGGASVNERLQRIETMLSSLSGKLSSGSSCFCGDLVEAVNKSQCQLEKNINQSFRTETCKIVHSLHENLFSSANDLLQSVRTDVSIIVEDKIDELVDLSSTAIRDISIRRDDLSQSFHNDTSLLDELTAVEPFHQTVFPTPTSNYADITSDWEAVNSMAKLSIDYQWLHMDHTACSIVRIDPFLVATSAVRRRKKKVTFVPGNSFKISDSQRRVNGKSVYRNRRSNMSSHSRSSDFHSVMTRHTVSMRNQRSLRPLQRSPHPKRSSLPVRWAHEEPTKPLKPIRQVAHSTNHAQVLQNLLIHNRFHQLLDNELRLRFHRMVDNMSMTSQ